MKNLYIDFDGVIMDTINKTYEMMDEENIDRKNNEEVKKFYENIDWKRLLKETKEINGAIEKVKKLNDSSKFNVAILTHINSLEEAVEKVRFIRKFYDDITVIPVPKAISKTKMVHTKNAILVDDYTGNLVEWRSEDGIGIKFSTTPKQSEFKVIDDLDKIFELF